MFALSSFAWGILALMASSYLVVALLPARWFASRPRVLVGLLALSVFAVHLLIGWSLTGPFQAADETGYLGAAQYLSRTGPMYDMANAAFYPAGYSLLLTPAFALFDNLDHVYRAIHATNALLAVAQFLVTLTVLRCVVGASEPTARLAAFVTSLFPPYVLDSAIAWSENAIPLFLGVLVLTAHRLVHKPRPPNAILFGIVSAYTWSIHGRALLMPVIGVAFLVALAVRRRIALATCLVGVLTIVAGWFGATSLNHLIFSLGYDNIGSSYQAQAATGISQGLTFLGRAPLQFVWTLLLTYAGLAWYVVVATYGLALLGVVWLFFELVRRDELPPLRRWTVSFVLLVLAGVFVVAAGVPTTKFDPPRADHVIYGRYNDAFLWLPMAIGISLLMERARDRAELPRWVYLIMPLCLGLVSALALTTIAETIWRREVYLPVIWGAAHWFYVFDNPDGRVVLLSASLCSIAVCAVIMFGRRVFALSPLVLLLVFSAEAVFSYDRYLRRDLGQSTRARFESVAAFLPADKSQLSFNRDDFDVNMFYVLQYWLRPHRYVRYSAAKGELPPTAAIISVGCPLKANDCESQFVRHQFTNAAHSLWLKKTN